MGTPAAGFSAIDDSTDPAWFIDYLDRLAAELNEAKDQSLALLQPAPGQVVLDVGCGTGDDVRALARLVAPSGRAIGVDASRAMIEEARRRSARAALPVHFRVGDAHDLPFPPATFDACRAERVLQHLADPARAVAEMARVTRPSGRVVVLEPDWETMVLDHPDAALTRCILDARFARLPNPRIGRQLRRLLATAGLTEISVRPVTIVPSGGHGSAAGLERLYELLCLPEVVRQLAADGRISQAQGDRWLAGIAAAVRSGSFFAAVTSFLVAGTKPG